MKTSFNPSLIRLIAGIGNPEKQYANTYHNAGLRFISFLEEEVRPPERGRTSLVLFSSPVSMNLSGGAIKKALSHSRAKPEELLLVHDDSDLALGTYRFSFGSQGAGHHGVQSVIDALGTRDFWRLRLGIRDPLVHREKRAEDFVLRAMPLSHRRTLTETFSSIVSTYDFIRFLS